MTQQLVTVQLVGQVIVAMVSLMLLLLFWQLPRFGASRGLVAPWIWAWAAQVLSVSGFGVESGRLLVFGAEGMTGLENEILSMFHYSGRYLFLVMVTAGALQAAGRPLSPRLRNVLSLAALLLGLVVFASESVKAGNAIQMFAVPVLFFGAAQLVLKAARGTREHGLLALSGGLMIYGTLRTIILIAQYNSADGNWSVFGGFDLYIEAFVLVILGGTIIALVVQDSFLQAADAREARLRDVSASELRLKQVIEAAGEAIVTFEPGGRINLANAAAERLFAFPVGGVVDKQLTALLSVEQEQLMSALKRARTEQPTEQALVTTGQRGDGELFPVEFTLGALAQEDTTGGVAILRDLTQRRAAESEREAFERRLAASEKMLAIGRVVSGVAHELNNPLAVVLGQSEQLVDTNDPDEMHAGLKLINEQAHRARHIVKDLLAFVRQRDDQMEQLDLVELAQRVTAAQRGVAETHGVALRTEVEGQIGIVNAERQGIEQVLINLLDNGMDAAAGGGMVRVLLRSVADRVELSVEDSGAGVPDHLVHRIYEPFFTTKPTGEGTGLGLPVSLGLVERHSGTLKFENRPKPGIGARFTMSLPVLSGEVAKRPPVAKPAILSLRTPRRREDGSMAEVLLIDDEPAVRATLARIFQRGGWQVREMSSGQAGIDWLMEVAECNAPDIILCDLKMPIIGGREVHDRLAAERPELLPRLIFVTGDVVEASTAAFLASAGRVVVEKPFTVAEISAAIAKVLDQSGDAKGIPMEADI